MPSTRSVRVMAAVSLMLSPVLAAAGQSSFAVSPFVSYIPSAATNPLAGFALTFGGTTGLALRSSAEMSISNPPPDSALGQPGGYRPWGADADAMLFLGGLGGGTTVFSRSLSPYVFAGIGMTGGDSAGSNVVRHGWSYGVGAAIPLGFDADIFAEARWRMSQYVLPTSEGAPDSKSSMRFGLSFHVGGGSNGPSRGVPQPRRRHRMDVSDGEQDVEYVVTPAPASPQVVVVSPAPAPEPQVVVVEPEPTPTVLQSAPVVVLQRPPARRRRTTTVIVTPSQPVVVAPSVSRPAARVYGRASTRSTAPASSGSISGGSSSSVRPGVASSRRSRTSAPARTQPSSARPAASAPARAQARPQARTTQPEAASGTQRVTRSRASRDPM